MGGLILLAEFNSTTKFLDEECDEINKQFKELDKAFII